MRQSEKTFCWYYSSALHFTEKNFLLKFDLFQITLVEKRPSRKHSEASALPWLQKTFTRCPFFNFGTLRKNQITLD